MPISKAISEELALLESFIADDDSPEQREEMHQRHIASFTQQLLPTVRRALEEETKLVVVADSWVRDAERFARWLLSRRARLGKSSASTSVHSTKPGRHPGLKRDDVVSVRRREAASLAKALRKATASDISDEEVSEHATELAQLLLSNWLAILEHALADADAEFVVLSNAAVPEDQTLDVLLEGVEAFAVPAESCMARLIEYQRSLRPGQPESRLSPSITIHRMGDATVAARPGVRLEQFFETVDVRADPAAAPPIDSIAEQVMDRSEMWLCSRPYALGHGRALSASETKRMAIHAVCLAASRALKGNRNIAVDDGELLVLRDRIIEDVVEISTRTWNESTSEYATALTPHLSGHLSRASTLVPVATAATCLLLEVGGELEPHADIVELYSLHKEEVEVVEESADLVNLLFQNEQIRALSENWVSLGARARNVVLGNI